MSYLGQFGPGFNAGIQSGEPSAKRVMTDLATGSTSLDGSYAQMARDFAIAGSFSRRMPGFETKNVAPQSTLGTDMITTRLITSLFTSQLDHQYADFLHRAAVFSLFDALTGVVRMVHLNMLNAKLRDDHEARVNALIRANRPTVQPGQIGIGAKRGITLVDAQRVAVDSNSGIHTIEQAKEHIRFLGMMPAPSEKHRGLAPDDNRRNTLETFSTVQVAGMIRYVTNVWGRVNTGDYLSFHLTRINNLNEDSTARSYKDFGPLQVVPVVSSTPHTSFGSGDGIDIEWQRVKKMSRSVLAANVPVDFGTEKYNPFVARIGSNRSSAFNLVRPIRSLATDRGIDALHYGPGEVTTYDKNGKVSHKCIYTKLEPNVVFQLGMVHKVHPRNMSGLSKHRLEEMLMQPSGKEVCDSTAAKIDIVLSTHVQ